MKGKSVPLGMLKICIQISCSMKLKIEQIMNKFLLINAVA